LGKALIDENGKRSNLFGFRDKTTEKKAKWRLDLPLQNGNRDTCHVKFKKRNESTVGAGAKAPCLAVRLPQLSAGRAQAAGWVETAV
jgi:hypothetical protein